MNFFRRADFFPIKKRLKSKDISKIISKLLVEFRLKDNLEIKDISSLTNIRVKSLLFVDKNKNSINSLDNIIITNDLSLFKNYSFENIFLVNDLDASYNTLANYIFKHDDNIDYSDDILKKNSSYISKFAKIDKTAVIQSNCYIGRGSVIGKNCLIKNNVVVKNCIMESNVIVGEGTIIGSTGFGFNLKNMGSNNLSPQIGIVYIQENVRIGANCTIDRGKIDFTFIGRNSMIDNQIHLAHNVHLGESVCIAAQTGISGSTIIGNKVVIGGQTGIAGHIHIDDNVVIAAKSGVTKNIKKNSIIAGFPATDIKEWKKNIIKMKKYGYKQN